MYAPWKLIFVLLLLLTGIITLYSQEFIVTQPRPEFDGKNLIISYEIITDNPSDQFYVWLEIEKSNGEIIEAKSLEGDIGEYIKGGPYKKISWTPEKDFVVIDENISLEIKAEKYRRQFNRGNVVFFSTMFPGFSQNIAKKHGAGWLLGVAIYGAAATGFLYHKDYQKTYNLYLGEENTQNRSEYYNEAQLKSTLSTGMFISAAALWTMNLIWAAAMPNNYRPLQNVKVSTIQTTGSNSFVPLLALKLSF